MSTSKRRKQRSSTNAANIASRSQTKVSASSLTPNLASRSSGRQVKLVTQGFHFGGGTAAQKEQRDVEKAEKESIRERRRKEQRLEELERGTGPSSSWNDSSSYNVLPASTSAAAIAGLLAGRRAEQEENYEDISVTSSSHANHNVTSNISNSRRKQSAELKKLLNQRRSLKVLLEDASASPIFKNAPNNFLKSLNVTNPYPAHRATGPICSICGYWGDIRCMRCHERVCGLKCSTVHNETRCERRI